MTLCRDTWDLILRLNNTQQTAVGYVFDIVDVPGVGNNIAGTVREAGVLVSQLRGTCLPGPNPNQRRMSCRFNVKGRTVAGVIIEMVGDAVRPPIGDKRFNGTFRVIGAGPPVQQGTAFADPGDTGTSGGGTTTDFAANAAAAASEEQSGSEGRRSRKGKQPPAKS